MVNSPAQKIMRSLYDLLILLALIEREGLGAYNIIAGIHKRFDVMLSPGVAYPALFQMEREGAIEISWAARKKTYSVTAKGRLLAERLFKDYMETHEKVVRAFNAIMSK